jgi:hypothetical protein
MQSDQEQFQPNQLKSIVYLLLMLVGIIMSFLTESILESRLYAALVIIIGIKLSQHLSVKFQINNE